MIPFKAGIIQPMALSSPLSPKQTTRKSCDIHHSLFICLGVFTQELKCVQSPDCLQFGLCWCWWCGDLSHQGITFATTFWAVLQVRRKLFCAFVFERLMKTLDLLLWVFGVFSLPPLLEAL